MSKPIDAHGQEEHATANRTQLSKSEVFELLSADRRQAVLIYLDKEADVVEIGELAEHIASQECDCSRVELTSQQRKRAYVGLYQCHLPKMADAGVVEYNSNRGTVALTDRSERLLSYLYFEETDAREQGQGLLERIFD